MKAQSFLLILCTVFLVIPFSNVEAVSLKDATTSELIRSTVVQTIQPYEKHFDVSIGGTDSFVNGLMKELENLPLDRITIQEIQQYLPNYVLRILAPKAYVSEWLGRDVAARFVCSVLQRKLCGPAILSPEQAAPVKEILDQLWEKTQALLDQHDLGSNKKSIDREMRILIGRCKRSLEDPTFISAAVDIHEASANEITNTFQKILDDVTNPEVSNASLKEKYENTVGIFGDIPIVLDRSTPEVRLLSRLREIPLVYAMIVDRLHNRTESLLKRKQFGDIFKPLNARIETIESEIQKEEMAQFGQSKIIPENKRIHETVNDTFLSELGGK